MYGDLPVVGAAPPRPALYVPQPGARPGQTQQYHQQQHPSQQQQQQAADEPFYLETAPHDPRVGFAATCVEAFELLCRYNSAVTDADAPDNLTAFHCVSEPPVSLQRYLGRLSTQAEWDPEGVLLALRLAGRFSSFADLPLSMLVAHRLLAVTGIMALKAHSDRFRSNRTVARVAGMHLPEVNGLELEAFKGVGYSAVVYEHEVKHMLDRAALAVAAFRTGLADQAATLARSAFCDDLAMPLGTDPRAFVSGGREAITMVATPDVTGVVPDEPGNDAHYHTGEPGNGIDSQRVASITPSMWGPTAEPVSSVTALSTASQGAYLAAASAAAPTQAWYEAKPVAGGLPAGNVLDTGSVGGPVSQTATSVVAMNNRLNHHAMGLWHPGAPVDDGTSAAPSSRQPSQRGGPA